VSDSSAALRQKLSVAADLHGVVRTMKAMAASSIAKYEQSVQALAEYDRTVKLGLAVVLRDIQAQPGATRAAQSKDDVVNAIVFGSDQGLVGQFNDLIAQFSIEALAKVPGSAVVWAVGERVHARLADAGVTIKGLFQVPNDVSGIAALVGQLQVRTETPGIFDGRELLYVFHNRQSGASVYEPMGQRILPLDRVWRDAVVACRWPTKSTPEILAEPGSVLRALVREYLFISLFQACAESLSSENASRLAAMQRAEKNIEELTDELSRRFHRVRQTSIDEELFDVVSGFEALTESTRTGSPPDKCSRPM
jgi:F-type H+-transporting ATPase subunit gamma